MPDLFEPESKLDGWPSDYAEQFWKAYPNRVGKGQAIKALERTKKSGVVWSELMAGLARYKDWLNEKSARNWRPDAKHPATWLNGFGWKDELPRPKAAPANGYAADWNKRAAATLEARAADEAQAASISKEARAAKAKKILDEIAESIHLEEEIHEAEAKKKGRYLIFSKSNNKLLESQYRRQGIEPMKASDGNVISLSLLLSLGWQITVDSSGRKTLVHS